MIAHKVVLATQSGITRTATHTLVHKGISSISYRADTKAPLTWLVCCAMAVATSSAMLELILCVRISHHHHHHIITWLVCCAMAVATSSAMHDAMALSPAGPCKGSSAMWAWEVGSHSCRCAAAHAWRHRRVQPRHDMCARACGAMCATFQNNSVTCSRQATHTNLSFLK